MDAERVLFRLKKAIAFLKGRQKIENQQDIVNALGYNKSSVSQALNNKNNYLTEGFIRNFAKAFDLNEEWILHGKGRMVIKETFYTDTDFFPNNVLYEPERQNFSTANDAELLGGRKLYEVTCKVIPVQLLSSLKDAKYSQEVLDQLRSERITLTKSTEGQWFKIEIQGASMSSGSVATQHLKKNLSNGSWVYCQSMDKQYWTQELSKIQQEHPYCFFHNTAGVMVRNVLQFDAPSEVVILGCNHPNKKLFPNLSIQLSECSFIAKVVKVLVYI